MKSLKYIFLVVLLVGGSVGCDEGFDEMNVNPNTVTTAEVNHLFTYALNQTTGSGVDYLKYWSNFIYHYHWFNQVTGRGSNNELIELNTIWTDENLWGKFFGTGMQELVQIQKQIDDLPEDQRALNANRYALPLIVKVYKAHELVDVYGDIPYSDAFKGRLTTDPVFKPLYDTQEAVIDQMLSDLKSAKDMIDVSIDDAFNYNDADIWFDGDLTKWKKFANSLRLRIAMRLSEVNPSKAGQVITEILSDADGVMESNDDSFLFEHHADGRFVGARGYIDQGDTKFAGEPVVDFMYDNADPRLRIYYFENEYTPELCADLGLTYNARRFYGGPSSPDEIADNQILFRERSPENGIYDTLSRVNPRFFDNRVDGHTGQAYDQFLNYAEVCFLKAEAAVRGFTSDDPQTWYENGIRASIETQFFIAEQAGVENWVPLAANEIDDYIASADVAWDAGKGLELIMVQSWLNSFKDAILTWNNWKRTGFPNENTTPAMRPLHSNGTLLEIPTRYRYPDGELVTNETNLTQAIDRQGGTAFNTLYGRVWWDVD
ncbi:SusD/RagB family nutrient-binding outer membrane lipoprotein [Fulvivirgaceae bacterium BMA12]|uniref:SusD/RagB family nutrient-binding outer membrane lipoprotein n=1 Tax=Agaribacillus aureus TaxID=3051825 RepID=A0ABT8LEX8_9BACT|nr:SusD/RagB family nutrient-binding outer membrane lipoprotein [Fulvivirgaceae bacterium BMA12]